MTWNRPDIYLIPALVLLVTPACSHKSAVTPTSETREPPSGNEQVQLDDGKPQMNLPRVRLSFHDKTGARTLATITAQVASTEPQREKGLMFRRVMPDDEGMLFVFDREQLLYFWMKNTYLPLDMLFLDSNRRVIGIVEGAIPFDERPRGPGRPAMYVVEVTAGFVQKHHIEAGSVVSWEQVH